MLAFNGKELTRNYVLYHNKTVEVGGQQVALFDVGDGGNQCGTATVIVWKPENGEIQSAAAGDDCGSPPAGRQRPEHLFRALPAARRLEDRANLDTDRRAAGRRHAAVHAATRHRLGGPRPGQALQHRRRLRQRGGLRGRKKLLGDAITDVATGLLVGGGTEFDAVRRILRQRLRAACLRRRRCLHGDRPAAATNSISRSRARTRSHRPGRPSRTGRPTSRKPRKRRSAR